MQGFYYSKALQLPSFDKKIKPSRKSKILLSFTILGKFMPQSRIFNVANIILTVFIKIQFQRKFSNLQYIKTCVKGPLKIDLKILMTNGNLMKVKSIAECS